MQYPGGTAPGYHFYSMQQSTALRTKAFILAKAPCGAVSFCFSAGSEAVASSTLAVSFLPFPRRLLPI